MKDMIKMTSAGFLGVALIIALACVGPMALIWSINTVAEYSTVGLYIEHTPWTYIGALVFLICVRGGK